LQAYNKLKSNARARIFFIVFICGWYLTIQGAIKLLLYTAIFMESGGIFPGFGIMTELAVESWQLLVANQISTLSFII
jgi:hypothetical protein